MKHKPAKDEMLTMTFLNLASSFLILISARARQVPLTTPPCIDQIHKMWMDGKMDGLERLNKSYQVYCNAFLPVIFINDSGIVAHNFNASKPFHSFLKSICKRKEFFSIFYLCQLIFQIIESFPDNKTFQQFFKDLQTAPVMTHQQHKIQSCPVRIHCQAWLSVPFPMIHLCR